MSDLFSLTLGHGLVYGFLSGFIAYFLGYAIHKSLLLFEGA